MVEDFERCYRAVSARDARFDGWFVTAVTSTHIYCRPSCPARTPGRRNVRFYPSSAAAQQAGFRACKRCRPDASPGSPEWNVRQDVVARAMRMIGEGVVDRGGVAGLARRLAYSPRQLNRLLVSEVGAGPLALARAQRAQTARVLIETTELPVSSVAFAAGFASVRQFNDTIRAVFASTPTELRRRRARGTKPSPSPSPSPDALSLRLAHRLPYDGTGTLAFLAQRAVPGVEAGSSTHFARTLTLPHGCGTVELVPDDGHVRARLRLDDLRDLTPAVQRCRRLLDLDADPVAVADHLGRRPRHRGAMARRVPGLRVPGTVDPHELALRAVVGQQVSVASARAVLGRLVAEHGDGSVYGALLGLGDRTEGLTHRFPDMATIAALDPERLPLPRRRARTLVTMAEALAGGALASTWAPTPKQPGGRCAPSRASGPGPPTTSPCGGSATPTSCCRETWACNTPSPGWAWRTRQRPSAELARSWRPWRSYATLHLWGYRPDEQARAS